VAAGGYVIGYDIYEGNTYEGHTLIPFIENIKEQILKQYYADGDLITKVSDFITTF